LDKKDRLSVLVYTLSRVLDESKRLRRTLDSVWGSETVDAIIAELELPGASGLESGVIGSVAEDSIYVVHNLSESGTYEALLFFEATGGVWVRPIVGDTRGHLQQRKPQNFLGTRSGDLMEAYAQIIGG